MLHIVKTTNLIIKRAPLLYGLLFAAVLVFCPLTVAAQECKQGICAEVGSRWDAQKKDYVRTVRFSGFPRLGSGYVTDHYNIRGLPDPYPKQYEAWPNHIGNGFVLKTTTDISIQACRIRGIMRRSYCTDWVSFRIY